MTPSRRTMHIQVDMLTDLLTTFILPFATFAELVSLCPVAIPSLDQTRATLGVPDHPIVPESNADPDALTREIVYLLWILQHSIGAFGFYLSLLKQLSHGPRDGTQPTAPQVRASLTEFLTAYFTDIRASTAGNQARVAIFNGLTRGHSVETAAQEVATRLIAWGFPSPDSDQRGPILAECLSDLPDMLACLVDPSTALIFDCFGSMCTQLAYSVWLSLASDEERFTQDAAYKLRDALLSVPAGAYRSHLQKQERALAEGHARYLPEDDKLEGHYNLWRLRSRVAGLAFAARISLRFLSKAVQRAYHLNPLPAPLYLNPDHVSALHYLQDYVNTRRLSLKATGASSTPSSSLLTRTAGLKYLLSQLDKASSAFRMPDLQTGLQTDWEQWFEKLSSLSTIYALSDHDIIHGVTTHLPASHLIMVGWEAKVDSLRQTQTPLSLELFFSHARERLFTEAATRKNAWYLLHKLCVNDAKDYSDCKELVAGLRDLFRRLYPSTVTSELEPVTRRESVQLVHNLLIRLHSRPLSAKQTTLIAAWCTYTWDHVSLWRKFLDPKLHTSIPVSESLYNEYLNDTYRQLGEAHDMYVTLKPAVKTQLASVQHTAFYVDDGMDEPLTEQSVFALNTPYSERRKVHWEQSHSDPKQRRTEPGTLPASRADNSLSALDSERPRSGSQIGGRGGRGGGRGGRGTGRQPSSQLLTAQRRGNFIDIKFSREQWLQLEANAPLRASYWHLARALRFPDAAAFTKESCIQAVYKGLCPFCHSKRHYQIQDCGRWRAAVPTPQEALECLKHRTTWRRLIREHDGDVSAACAALQPPIQYTRWVPDEVIPVPTPDATK